MRDLAHFTAMLVRRRWPSLGLGLVLMLVTVLANIGLLALAGWFITATGIAGAAAIGVVTFDLFRPSAGIRFFAITRTVSRYLERLATHDATFRVLKDLRVWAFQRSLPLDLGTLRRFRSGDMLQRITADIDALDNLYLRVLGPSLIAAIAAAGAAVALGWLAPVIAVAVLALLALAGLGIPMAAGRLGSQTGTRMAELWADLRVQALDFVQGLGELRVFGAAERHVAALASGTRSHHKLQARMAHITGLSNAATGLLGNLALWAVLFLGADLLAAGTLNGAVVVMAGLGTLALYEAVAPLPLAYQYLGRTRTAARRLRAFAETPPQVRDPAVPAPPPADTSLTVEGVWLTYPGQHAPALEDVSLTVPAGSHVAVAGPSGAGKSSLAGLLLRLWDPEAGQVRLGGVDIRDLAQHDLHARIGYLSQEADIFSGTVRDNLHIADPGAGAERLWAALRAAGLAEHVAALPDGLDSFTGEGGVRFSGGQARRLALARVILKDAPILLLDEPTEGLDAATESEVLATLSQHAAGRTMLLISHRPAVLALAPRRVALTDGRLTETDSASGAAAGSV